MYIEINHILYTLGSRGDTGLFGWVFEIGKLFRSLDPISNMGRIPN